MSDKIQNIFEDSIRIKRECIENNLSVLSEIGNQIVESIIKGKKLMLCGNGGSAADAQHLAAELLIRLRPNINREGIPAIALAQDTSTITACSNDLNFDSLYARLVKTLGQSGDSLIGISTSGNSKNIISALKMAKEMNIKTFGFLGCGGGKALSFCENAFIVPSNITGRVQESHITAGHALMEYIEDKLIKKEHIK